MYYSSAFSEGRAFSILGANWAQLLLMFDVCTVCVFSMDVVCNGYLRPENEFKSML